MSLSAIIDSSWKMFITTSALLIQLDKVCKITSYRGKISLLVIPGGAKRWQSCNSSKHLSQQIHLSKTTLSLCGKRIPGLNISELLKFNDYSEKRLFDNARVDIRDDRGHISFSKKNLNFIALLQNIITNCYQQINRKYLFTAD
jgi:hypothetical protein